MIIPSYKKDIPIKERKQYYRLVLNLEKNERKLHELNQQKRVWISS